MRTRAESQALRSNLVLGAVGVWMLNALSFRPDGGSNYKVIEASCCQQILDPGSDDDSDEYLDDDPPTMPIYYNRGLYFLGDIMQDGDAFRVPYAIWYRIDEAALCALYGRQSLASLEFDIGISRVLAPKGTLTHESRIPNKRPKTTAVEHARDPDVEEEVVDWQLGDRGIRLRPIARDRGRDVDERRAVDPDEDEDMGGGAKADEAIAKIWRQAAFDILNVGPNKSGSRNPSYILLSKDARRNVGWAPFQTTDFRGVFEKIQIRFVSKEFWATTLFDRYVPLIFL